jgi:hypothetical protein
MNRIQHHSSHNVVRMSANPGESQKTTRSFSAASGGGTFAAAGSADDPRMQEALRLAKAFLAIEDAQARGALVALAESLVSRDWPLGAQRL